jgi:hypothetical protein
MEGRKFLVVIPVRLSSLEQIYMSLKDAKFVKELCGFKTTARVYEAARLGLIPSAPARIDPVLITKSDPPLPILKAVWRAPNAAGGTGSEKRNRS